jgi:hypothetical protein
LVGLVGCSTYIYIVFSVYSHVGVFPDTRALLLSGVLEPINLRVITRKRHVGRIVEPQPV